ncbi:MAG: hypothetical protein ACRDGE_02740 [Candidatus Limnocylindria bacterium]
MARAVGAVVNVGIRLWIAYFLAEVLLNPEDPRFAGKALPVRNLIIVGAMSLLFPARHLFRRPWRHYPVWWDALYLSLFWLDMAGNSFDLYETYRTERFDLIPHFHGTGAVAAALHGGIGMSPWRAFLVTNALHVALEVQEYATDVFFDTRNVHGWSDSLGDIAAGLLGSAVYTPIAARFPGVRSDRR